MSVGTISAHTPVPKSPLLPSRINPAASPIGPRNPMPFRPTMIERRLRCDRCGCVLEMTADELLRCSHGDWPRCCMVAMVLEVADQSVRPNAGTELERPERQGRTPFRG